MTYQASREGLQFEDLTRLIYDKAVNDDDNSLKY